MEIWKKMWVGVFFWTQCTTICTAAATSSTDIKCHSNTTLPKSVKLFTNDRAIIFSRSQHWAKSISPSRDSRDHMAGPISVSLALSQTTAEAARPRIRGSYIAWYARLLLGFRCYSLTDIAGITRWVSIDTQYPQVRAVASTAALYRTATRASLSQHYYIGLNQFLTY